MAKSLGPAREYFVSLKPPLRFPRPSNIGAKLGMLGFSTKQVEVVEDLIASTCKECGNYYNHCYCEGE